jgi:hypothetical protein
MNFVLQCPWVRRLYYMKQKALHILPKLTFIIARKKTRFKSHVCAKRNVCVHYFSNNHFNIIIVLQCISITVTNPQSQSEVGYTTVFRDKIDKISDRIYTCSKCQCDPAGSSWTADQVMEHFNGLLTLHHSNVINTYNLIHTLLSLSLSILFGFKASLYFGHHLPIIRRHYTNAVLVSGMFYWAKLLRWSCVNLFDIFMFEYLSFSLDTNEFNVLLNVHHSNVINTTNLIHTLLSLSL